MASISDLINNGDANDRALVDNTLITNYSGVICLRGQVNSAGNYTTFKKAGAASGYVVPTGKTFKYFAMVLAASTGDTNPNLYIYIGPSTGDIGDKSAGPPTGFVATQVDGPTPSAAGARYPRSVVGSIEAGNYVSCQITMASVGASIWLYGYEE